jgi:pimeloyl-ACP methyl ester carboxylesterase
VAVTRTQTGAAALTNGVDGRLGRIPLPESAPGGAQIRIDIIISATGPPRFEVYIGGTVDFRALAADDAFDLTSNVAGVGGLPAGGIRAVRQAMLDAGIAPDSQVTFTGYSQGGMVAAALAASGDYNVQGVVTVAAPAGNVQLPAGIPALIIEHTDDFIPALGGVQTNTEALVVQREAFAANDEPPGLAAPAHRMPYYRETAALMDQARSEQLVDARHQLDAFSAGAESIVSSYYYASRQP